MKTKKLHKQDIINILLLITGILLFVGSIYILNNIYGSKTDWISQHFRLPEYLRNLFYKNKNIFPNFSFNLGAGQNIYHLIYYGLFNPIILVSYLLPFIKMKTYIIIINIILVILSLITLYKWILSKYNSKIAFLSTLIFITSGCLIYHTHRHFMFIDYMLFQILALISTEKYFKEKKVLNLIISTFLIILISYYFSVGSIFAIVIYAIYNYLIYEKNINLKTFFIQGTKFVLNLLIPVLLASFILIPTMYILLTGRSETKNTIDLLTVLIPTINPKIFLYDSYSIGLTSIFIYSLIDNINTNNKSNKFLAITTSIILIFPIFNYILNGGMYISGKSLIPFLPLCILLISNTLNNILTNKVDKKNIIIFIGIIIFTIITNLKYNKLIILIIESLIYIISILIYKYKKQNIKIFIPYFIIIILICLITNYSDVLITQKHYKNIEEKNIDITKLYDNNIYRTANLNNILENSNNVLNDSYFTTSFYSSTSNKEYLNFVRNTFKNETYNKDYHTITQSSNILFNIYMGNKYLISDYDLKGYNLKIKDKTNAYINEDTFSIGYTNNKLMSLKEFNTLSYPYTIDALLNYTIVNKDIPSNYESKIKDFNNELILDKYEKYKTNNHYKFTIKKTKKININLKNPTDNILIITFKMNYHEKKTDPSITINNITNTLSKYNWKYYNKNETFHYVISQNDPIDNLSIELGKGTYDISEIKIYEYDYNELKNIKNNHEELEITNLEQDTLEGNISVKNDSYFQLSIPYDKGFTIKLDNKKINYEKINTAFLGFKIPKGNHNVKITYKAPLSSLGNKLSLITLCLSTIYLLIKKNYFLNK